jgi:DNA polymerase-3 subunit delta
VITTLTGSNSFGLRAELDRRVADFVAAYTDMGLEKLDGEEADYLRLVDAVQNLPFLAERKLVVLRNPGANKEFADKFEDLLPAIPEVTDVIIYEPKLDKRSSYAKLLQKKTELKAFEDLNERELPAWLAAEAKARGGSLSQTDALYLVNRAGYNQQLLTNELDKLLAYDPAITRTTIDLLTDLAPQSTIFQLLDAAFSGNTRRALEIYEDQRAQRVDPQAMIPMLAWQLQTLAIIKAAGPKSADDIAREAKLNPFVVRKSMGIASKLSLTRLKELIHDLRVLDVRLKSESIDADEALKLYLLSLS